jgi:hypothetical protein
MDMTGLAASVAAVFILTLVPAALRPAVTEQLAPLRATSLRLDDVNGVACYTVEGHGYHVVATVAGATDTPVRLEGTLLPGVGTRRTRLKIGDHRVHAERRSPPGAIDIGQVQLIGVASYVPGSLPTSCERPE